jgi:hypothetical protein
MEPDLATRCVDSINKNAHLRNSIKNATDTEQRNVLTAWYVGYEEASGAKPTTNLDSFIKEVLPEVRKAALTNNRSFSLARAARIASDIANRRWRTARGVE